MKNLTLLAIVIALSLSGADAMAQTGSGVVPTTKQLNSNSMTITLDKAQLVILAKAQGKIIEITLTTQQLSMIRAKNPGFAKVVVKILSSHVDPAGSVKVVPSGNDLLSISSEPVY